MKYNVAFIPSDFEERPKEEFDPEYMGQTIRFGLPDGPKWLSMEKGTSRI